MTEEISLQINNEEIVFADLTNRESLEAVCVCRSGNIFLFDLEKGENVFLGKLPFNSVPNLMNDFNPIEVLQDLNPSELGDLLENQSEQVESIESISEKNQNFIKSLSLNAKLYSFENYICIVQQKGTEGIVLHLSNPSFQKRLNRGDYCVEHCSFPIAFYTIDNQTFLIHGTDWNRLDITCLETDKLSTDRIVDYETKSNYFDYFHSSLSISPDEKHFTSNGWIWHPYGQNTLYSIDDFLKNFELSHQNIDLAEDCYSFDWDRPLCWVDENTLAIGFSKNTEDYGKSKFSDEILFIDIVENKIINRIEFNGFANTSEGDVFGDLFYDKEKSQFVSLNQKKGLLISDIEGKKIFEERNLNSHDYSSKHKLFYRINYNNQTVEMVKV